MRVADMAIPVQRTTELQANQRGDARTEAQQQQFAARLIREQELKEQQVQETPRPEDAQIQRDGRGSGGAYSQNKQKKKQNKEEPAASKKVNSGLFDVSI